MNRIVSNRMGYSTPGDAPAHGAGRPAAFADIIEVPLLLSEWQVSALEQAASQRGLTAAEMARRVLSAFIDEQPESNCALYG